MTLNIEEIRRKLKDQQENKGGTRTGGGDAAIYPFWNIKAGQEASLRFLPDKDPTNDFFWVERLVIDIPFNGIKGQTQNVVTVQVPCMDMFGEVDPILAETKSWWKDESHNDDLPYGATSLKDLARKYWKKKSYVFQGFVVSSALTEENPPENPIRRFVINPSIFDIIRASIMDPDMEDLPIDYVTGRDFKLKVTKKGEYSNYGSSNWSPKVRGLNQQELEAIEQFGLFNLKEYLPRKPAYEDLEIIKAMFHSSIQGDEFDTDEFGKYYRPRGSNYVANESTPSSTKSTSGFRGTVQPTNDVDEDDDIDEVPVKAYSPNKGAEEALARLKANNARPEIQEEEAPVTPTKKRDADALLEMIRNRSRNPA